MIFAMKVLQLLIAFSIASIFPLCSPVSENEHITPQRIDTELQSISLLDESIYYNGRFDYISGESVLFCWSSSEIKFRFKGTSLSLSFTEHHYGFLAGNDHLQIHLDDREPIILDLYDGNREYLIATDMPDRIHEVTIIKRTEASVGVVEWTSLKIDGEGKLLSAPAPPKKHILFIGDSITAGYGNEGKSSSDSFHASIENSTKSYGAVAADLLGVEYSIFALSGFGLLRNYDGEEDNTIPKIFNNMYPLSPKPWSFDGRVPDLVVINLGTNDFSTGVPDRDRFIETYINFVKDIRIRYPNTQFIAVIGPMMIDGYPEGQTTYSTMQNYLNGVVVGLKQDGFEGFYIADLTSQNSSTGYGASWHPNIKQHRINGEELANYISLRMGWYLKQ